MRLRSKILLSTVIPLTILVVIVIRLDLLQTEREVVAQAREHVLSQVRASALLLDGELRRASQVANTAALALSDSSEWTVEEARRFANSIVTHDPVIYGFSIAWDQDKGPRGKGLEAMTSRLSDGVVKDMDLAQILDYTKDKRYQKVRRTLQPLWSNSLDGTALKDVDIVLYIAPIIYEGAFVGATVVDVEIDRLGTLHNRIGLIGAPWWLYDEDSMLIGKSGDLESGTAVNLTESDRILTSVITKSSEKGSSLINQARSSDAISAIRILDPTKNDKSVLSLAKVPLTNWVLLNTRDLAKEMGPVHAEVTKRAVGSVLLGGMAIGMVSFGLWIVVVRPIRKLDGVMQRVGAGDFQARTGMHGKDEISQLGMELDRTVPRVQELLETQASLAAAHVVQDALLPRETYEGPSIVVSGRSQSSDQIGGDFFDVLHCAEQGEGRTAVLLGDVSGHGVPAALLSATARAYLRGSLLQGAGLDSAITMANTRIKEDTAEARFIVFIGAIFDANQHRLDVTAAGHPGFLLRSSSASFETINAKGIPLGIELESVFETTVFDSIADGDLLMLASDGAWETRNSAEEEFGIERVLKIVVDHRDQTPDQILGMLFNAIAQWHGPGSLEDDCTIVIAKMLG